MLTHVRFTEHWMEGTGTHTRSARIAAGVGVVVFTQHDESYATELLRERPTAAGPAYLGEHRLAVLADWYARFAVPTASR